MRSGSTLHTLLACDGLGATLPCSGIALGALTPGWKTTTMAIPTVGANISQTLDVLSNLTLQCALDDVPLVDDGCDLTDIRLTELPSLLFRIHPCLGKDFVCELGANAVDIAKGVSHLLTFWDVDTCNTWHLIRSFKGLESRSSRSTLALFQPRILLVDDVTLSFSDHDLTIRCLASNTAFNFHVITRSLCRSSLAVDDSAFRHVIRTQLDLDLIPWKNPDVELPHSTADVGEDVLPVFQLDLESGIWQGLGNNCV